MAVPEVVDFARNFAAMVRVQGPDPKGLKMGKHAFHQYNSGKTTLSASGMLLPDTLYTAEAAEQMLGGNHARTLALVVTVASVVEPFLSIQHRQSVAQGRPELIPGSQIDVMVEGKLRLEKDDGGSLDKEASHWLTAQLIRLVDVPVSSLALESIIEASPGSLDDRWEVGWSLASHDNGSRSFMDDMPTETDHGNASFVERQRHLTAEESSYPRIVGKSTTRIAILGVFFYLKDMPNIAKSPSNRIGDSLLAVGSPFGVLSPVHFFNSMSVGSVANCYPPRSSNISLLMADIRCLPGMEGAPVFGKHGHFIGLLIRPLRQKSSGAEIQLVIPWEAIATACSDLLLKEPQNAEKGIHINKENLNAVGNAYIHQSDGPFCYNINSYCPSPLPVEKAMASVCLITIDEGVWASGVLLNGHGLILTNAHLLEPWRFGKTTINGGRNGTKSEIQFFPSESPFRGYGDVDSYLKSQRLLPKALKVVDSSVADENNGYKLIWSHKSNKSIRVRLDHVSPWIWCDAKVVYVCKGPLDVALLQLEHIPGQLYPINVDIADPPLGSKTYVIGHGLFGPRCGFSPSVCSGVVAKIVKAKVPPYCQSIHGGDSHIPAMLETTAAVHPGASGGAVINSEGQMIGLVTSNARHGRGTVIPYLNFSIPCAVLAPIFEFARDMRDISLLLNLDQPNEHLSSVWALMPPLSPKPSPNLPESLPEDDVHQRKGSKFAKFIAERNKVMRSSTRLGELGSISNEILPSKL